MHALDAGDATPHPSGQGEATEIGLGKVTTGGR